MALRAASLGRFKEVLDAGRDAGAAVDEPVRVAVELAGGVPRDLALALKAALVPQTPRGMVHVGVCVAGAPVVVNPEADVCIVVCADAALAATCARGWSANGVPVCLVGETSLAVPETGGVAAAEVGSVVASDPDRAVALLGAWLAEHCGKAMALAANFRFCRRPLAEREVLSCAAANAGVGAVDLVKGADFPVMCATESSMVLKIASMYGYPVGVARAQELLAVVLGGMAMRALARRGVRVLPRAAWAVRGGVGWAGTYLTGQAVVWRFEAGEAFDERVAWAADRVREAVAAVWERAATLTGRIVEVEPGALYSEPGLSGLGLVPVRDVVDVVDGSSARSWFEVGGMAADGR